MLRKEISLEVTNGQQERSFSFLCFVGRRRDGGTGLGETVVIDIGTG